MPRYIPTSLRRIAGPIGLLVHKDIVARITDVYLCYNTDVVNRALYSKPVNVLRSNTQTNFRVFGVEYAYDIAVAMFLLSHMATECDGNFEEWNVGESISLMEFYDKSAKDMNKRALFLSFPRATGLYNTNATLSMKIQPELPQHMHVVVNHKTSEVIRTCNFPASAVKLTFPSPATQEIWWSVCAAPSKECTSMGIHGPHSKHLISCQFPSLVSKLVNIQSQNIAAKRELTKKFFSAMLSANGVSGLVSLDISVREVQDDGRHSGQLATFTKEKPSVAGRASYRINVPDAGCTVQVTIAYVGFYFSSGNGVGNAVESTGSSNVIASRKRASSPSMDSPSMSLSPKRTCRYGDIVASKRLLELTYPIHRDAYDKTQKTMRKIERKLKNADDKRRSAIDSNEMAIIESRVKRCSEQLLYMERNTNIIEFRRLDRRGNVSRIQSHSLQPLISNSLKLVDEAIQEMVNLQDSINKITSSSTEDKENRDDPAFLAWCMLQRVTSSTPDMSALWRINLPRINTIESVSFPLHLATHARNYNKTVLAYVSKLTEFKRTRNKLEGHVLAYNTIMCMLSPLHMTDKKKRVELTEYFVQHCLDECMDTNPLCWYYTDVDKVIGDRKIIWHNGRGGDEHTAAKIARDYSTQDKNDLMYILSDLTRHLMDVMVARAGMHALGLDNLSVLKQSLGVFTCSYVAYAKFVSSKIREKSNWLYDMLREPISHYSTQLRIPAHSILFHLFVTTDLKDTLTSS